MPAKLAHRFTRPKEIKRHAWNNIVRLSLAAAGYFWVRTFALKHFEPGASQRYQMVARKEGYRRHRANLARLRGETPADLVFSGKAREIARLRAAFPQLAKVDARATSSRQVVRVPIPIGHPINPNIASDGGSNDFGRLTNDETQAMTRVAKEEMERQVTELWRQKETVVIGAAA